MENNNHYKVNHRYNASNTPILSTTDQPSVKSYRQQIELLLSRWHEKQQQCQPIDFDKIMEMDLTRQLEELEEQERHPLQQCKQDEADAAIAQELERSVQLQGSDFNQPSKQKEESSNPPVTCNQKQEYICIYEQRQISQSKFTIFQANQMKIQKMIHLLESYTNNSKKKKKKISILPKTK